MQELEVPSNVFITCACGAIGIRSRTTQAEGEMKDIHYSATSIGFTSYLNCNPEANTTNKFQPMT